jgi:RNA polymerase sigma-70 factor (sigma-E family)
VRQIESELFATFAMRELPSLVRYAHMLTGDSELAHDLVQDVMLKAHSKWERISEADRPTLYVKTMIMRTYLSWRRRWSVRNVVLVDYTVEGEAEPDLADGVADRHDVWQRLAGLSRQQRAVLVLRYYERLSDEEIASMLGCAPGTVRGYASRALAALRLDLHAELSLPKENP